MCGIFGVVLNENSSFSAKQINRTTRALLKLSESRGKEAAGLAIYCASGIHVYKRSVSATEMMRAEDYKRYFDGAIGVAHDDAGSINSQLAIIGHSRLVTTGCREHHFNNQPVFTGRMVGIHNGIVVNDEELWKQHAQLERQGEVDTEVVVSMLNQYYNESGSLTEATRSVYEQIEGCASIAALVNNNRNLVLATNNGSLYVCRSNDGGAVIFSSELYILSQLFRASYLRDMFGEAQITKVAAGDGYLVNIDTCSLTHFTLSESRDAVHHSQGSLNEDLPIVDHVSEHGCGVAPKDLGMVDSSAAIIGSVDDAIMKMFGDKDDSRTKMKRCTKCVLPETFPYITFDENGVCNYCRNYRKREVKGRELLEGELRKKVKAKKDVADCIVSVSGGRDSSYGLHYFKEVMGVTPLAYTYDWGMVTDLARRNISRMCARLGIEHILISADIAKKRDNVRKNILAWMKSPDLGMIPIFMAGDKQFFYYANKLKKQTGIDLMVFNSGCPYEKTNFKTGFCGIVEGDTIAATVLSLKNKYKLLEYYSLRYLKNPAYMNSSMFDTLWAYVSSYSIPKEYIFLFEYIQWDEKEIMGVLRNEYDWELATDTSTSWRIGDGTAPFYNYIYYIVAGFSEHDTFRSNQVRAGVLSREEALKCVKEENVVRLDALKWYFDVLKLDPMEVLKVVHGIPTLYRA